MSLHLSRKNQFELLTKAAILTRSAGWRDDAVAFSASRSEGGPPVAIGVFQGFAGGEAEFHFAAEILTRGIIDAYKVVAFHPRGMNLSRLWVPIAADNGHALRAAIGAGFEIEHRKRGGMDGGEDAIVLSMTRETGLAAARSETETVAT